MTELGWVNSIASKLATCCEDAGLQCHLVAKGYPIKLFVKPLKEDIHQMSMMDPEEQTDKNSMLIITLGANISTMQLTFLGGFEIADSVLSKIKNYFKSLSTQWLLAEHFSLYSGGDPRELDVYDDEIDPGYGGDIFDMPEDFFVEEEAEDE